MTITAEMPGITKEDVKVSIQEGLVTIQAEKGDKKYQTELPVLILHREKPAVVA